MGSFASWVLARRYRPIVLAVAFAPLLPMLTVALQALDTAHRGTVQGVSSAMLGLAGIMGLAFVLGQNVPLLAGIGGLSLAAGIGIGALLRRGASATLTFQSILLACSVAVGGFTLFGSDAVFAPVVNELADVWREHGASDEQLKLLREMLPGVVVALGFVQLVAAGLLSLWWSNLAARRPGTVGTQFRALKLGRILGVPATIVMGLGLVLDIPLIQNLSPLALLGFGFQGLAVLHAWAHARGWKAAVIAPAYVLLVTPLLGVVLLTLGAVGLVDNWFNLRAPLGAR